MNQTILEMQEISKSFPGVKALDRVNFSCCRGEVHAIVGENGAGKSTLMKILSGAYHQDEGKIVLKGEEVTLPSPKDAERSGISIIYQEFNLIPDLTVSENIFLGHEPVKGRGVIDTTALYGRSKEMLQSLGAKVDVHGKVKHLSVANQQMIEIAKALSVNAEIIVMDEPTAVISGKELDSLFQVIRSLKNSGKTIIYISHRIDEIFQIADRVTVLKDGQIMGTMGIREVDKPTIISMMVGRSLAETFPPKEKGEQTEVLCLKGVCQGKLLQDINLTVYTGEILGVAGLVGSGRTELARAIFGADPIEKGEILFCNMKMSKGRPKTAIGQGIGFVTEDRKAEGIVASLSVCTNLTLAALNLVQKWGFLKKSAEKKIARDCINQFNILTPTIEQEVQYLSGGNQQKVILAKWLNVNPKMIILDEPTRGIDVGAKAEIYLLMRELAKKGTAILMISSELPEIIGMSDRIVVMYNGRIMGELSAAEATEDKILMMATGQTRM